MEPDERRSHGQSFGAAAAAYAAHRPGYATDAARWALDPAPGPRVVDLGAGTGKLTATLVALGAQVTAVDPDPAMLAELSASLPDVPALAGSAEAMPLPDGSADAVVGGQALHWFDMAAAGPEIARVLTPGGVLAGLWNLDDDRVPWVAGLERVSESLASATLTAFRTLDCGENLRRVQGELARGAAGAHLSGIDLPGLFTAPEVAEFGHGQRRTADSLLATIATHSRLLVMEPTARAALLARIRAYLASRPETASGEFTLPLVTAVLRARRL